MKINNSKYINIKDFKLDNIPRFTLNTALEHSNLSKSILSGIELYIVKIVEVVYKRPECKNDEKFWIECQINRLINSYLNWLGNVIKNFEVQVRVNNSFKPSIAEIKLILEFRTDENKYTYNYYVTINKED